MAWAMPSWKHFHFDFDQNWQTGGTYLSLELQSVESVERKTNSLGISNRKRARPGFRPRKILGPAQEFRVFFTKMSPRAPQSARQYAAKCWRVSSGKPTPDVDDRQSNDVEIAETHSNPARQVLPGWHRPGHRTGPLLRRDSCSA